MHVYRSMMTAPHSNPHHGVSSLQLTEYVWCNARPMLWPSRFTPLTLKTFVRRCTLIGKVHTQSEHMPTDKPRITITTSKPIYETISRAAALQGVSKSQVVNELLEAVHPPLMRTVALLEAARDAPQQVKDGLRDTVEKLEMELAGDYGKTLSQLDWLAAKTTQKSKEVGK